MLDSILHSSRQHPLRFPHLYLNDLSNPQPQIKTVSFDGDGSLAAFLPASEGFQKKYGEWDGGFARSALHEKIFHQTKNTYEQLEGREFSYSESFRHTTESMIREHGTKLTKLYFDSAEDHFRNLFHSSLAPVLEESRINDWFTRFIRGPSEDSSKDYKKYMRAYHSYRYVTWNFPLYDAKNPVYERNPYSANAVKQVLERGSAVMFESAAPIINLLRLCSGQGIFEAMGEYFKNNPDAEPHKLFRLYAAEHLYSTNSVSEGTFREEKKNRIFEYVIKNKFQISRSQLIHIGDELESDFESIAETGGYGYVLTNGPADLEKALARIILPNDTHPNAAWDASLSMPPRK